MFIGRTFKLEGETVYAVSCRPGPKKTGCGMVVRFRPYPAPGVPLAPFVWRSMDAAEFHKRATNIKRRVAE